MKICNTIVCLDTKRRIDLKRFQDLSKLPCKYNPHRFPGLSLKLPDFKTTVLLFKSGKRVCTGAKINGDACDFLRFVLDILDFPLVLAEFAKVQNYVGTGNVGYLVNLHKVYRKCRPAACYEPELFPGLVYKIKEHRLSAPIFYSGRFVLSGSKYLGDLNRAELFLNNLLILLYVSIFRLYTHTLFTPIPCLYYNTTIIDYWPTNPMQILTDAHSTIFYMYALLHVNFWAASLRISSAARRVWRSVHFITYSIAIP